MIIKKIALGLAIFILTIIFIVFVNESINPKPKYQSCYSRTPTTTTLYPDRYDTCYKSYQDSLNNYRERSFLIIVTLSVLAIIAGVLIRSVAPVSWGLGLAGVVMIVYVFIASYDEIGRPYRAIISGIALVILIWLTYARLGDKEQITGTPNIDKPIPATDDENI